MKKKNSHKSGQLYNVLLIHKKYNFKVHKVFSFMIKERLEDVRKNKVSMEEVNEESLYYVGRNYKFVFDDGRLFLCAIYK